MIFLLVAHIMKRNVATISCSASLEKAVDLMRKNRVSSLVVVERKKVMGIITSIDIGKAFGMEGLKKVKVKDIMPARLFFISPSESIIKAAEIMRKRRIGRLPVIKDGSLVGIISVADLNDYQTEIFSRADRVFSLRRSMMRNVGL